MSLRGGADYPPLTGGREELSKGIEEGKKVELGSHPSNNNRPTCIGNWSFKNIPATASALKELAVLSFPHLCLQVSTNRLQLGQKQAVPHQLPFYYKM